MTRGRLLSLTVCALLGLMVLTPSAAGPGITFVGMGFIPGGALDLSGLAGQQICNTPLTKTLFIDLLDSAFKVNATQTIADVIAEKMEGMAWGPDLPDGRHVLYVMSDNDLYPGLPTKIYAFAIDGAAAGLNYQPQELPEPLYPPGQVKKGLK
jgi:Esterase-like activity of phytase